MTTGTKCPRCDSPDPLRHPAMQLEGEVQVCPDPFHPITEHTITDDQIREVMESYDHLDSEPARVVRYTCRIALGVFKDSARLASTPGEVRRARGDIAKIVNARSAK